MFQSVSLDCFRSVLAFPVLLKILLLSVDVWMVEIGAQQVPHSIFSAFWDRQTSIPPELQALSNPVTNPEPAPQVLLPAALLT